MGTGAKRTGTECKSVVLIGHRVKKPFDILIACHYSRKTENRHRRVVGMHTHIYAVFVAYGHDCLKKIFHILAEHVLVNTFVQFEKTAEFLNRIGIAFREIAADETLCLYNNVLPGCWAGCISW